MIGTSHQVKRFSASTDAFLIDRQHEDIYDPDNGTMQFQGPSRSYGWEVKASAKLSAWLSWNAGLTQVGNAFFLGTSPRAYVDAAPHSVGNSSLTLNGFRGLYSTVLAIGISAGICSSIQMTPPCPPPRRTRVRYRPRHTGSTYSTLPRPKSFPGASSGMSPSTISTTRAITKRRIALIRVYRPPRLLKLAFMELLGIRSASRLDSRGDSIDTAAGRVSLNDATSPRLSLRS